MKLKELLTEIAVFKPERLMDIHREAEELTAILTTCAKHAKSRRSD
jgi:hypothetical protein